MNIQQKQPDPVEQKKHLARLSMFEFGTEFAVIIGGPLLGFVLLGKWLENRYHTKAFILIGIFAALGLSSYLIYKRLKDLRNLLK